MNVLQNPISLRRHDFDVFCFWVQFRYALTRREVVMIVMQRLIKIDNKVRTDPNFPAGIMGMRIFTLDMTQVIFKFIMFCQFLRLVFLFLHLPFCYT